MLSAQLRRLRRWAIGIEDIDLSILITRCIHGDHHAIRRLECLTADCEWCKWIMEGDEKTVDEAINDFREMERIGFGPLR